MRKTATKVREQTTSPVEARLNEFTIELEALCKNYDGSAQLLHSLFQRYYPSSSLHKSILDIYSKSWNKPRVNKLLNQCIEHLHLNEDQDGRNDSTCSKQVEFNDDSKNSRLLHIALMKNLEHVFRLLLKAGFSVNSVLSDQKTPLSMIVVMNPIEAEKRLEYIQLLIQHGANPLIRDVNDVSPFTRLCGMESNYPIVYNFFRDHLLSAYPDQIGIEFDHGIENAFSNWCVTMVVDLLEHGAVLNSFKTVANFELLLSQIATSVFQIRRSISYIDPLILCFTQIISHGLPCENYSRCIQKFIQLIYIPGVCFQANENPCKHPSVIHITRLLQLACQYGYLTKAMILEICTNDLPTIHAAPASNTVISQTLRPQLIIALNQGFDELIGKYHQSPVSLKTLSSRKIRQSLIKVNRKTIEQLNISHHLENSLFSS